MTKNSWCLFHKLDETPIKSFAFFQLPHMSKYFCPVVPLNILQLSSLQKSCKQAQLVSICDSQIFWDHFITQYSVSFLDARSAFSILFHFCKIRLDCIRPDFLAGRCPSQQRTRTGCSQYLKGKERNKPLNWRLREIRIVKLKLEKYFSDPGA